MYACGIGRRIYVYACGIYAGICAHARVYGMYAAYMRLPMPHAYMRLRPPPENAARIYVLGHRRVAALRVATLAESVHVLLCYLSTDVLLRYLRVHYV